MDVQECVGPLSLHLPNRDVVGLGSMFVVSLGDAGVFGITAAHCVDAALRADLSDRVSSAPGSPFVPDRPRVVWREIMIESHLHHRNVPGFIGMVAPIKITEAYVNRQTDIAVLKLMPDYGENVTPLDSFLEVSGDLPSVGEEVVVAGFFETDIRASHYLTADGRPVFQRISARLQAIKVSVKAVHPNGFRDMNWPCFQLDCPLFSGMSGGCVLALRSGNPEVIGVVSRDITTDTVASGTRRLPHA